MIRHSSDDSAAAPLELSLAAKLSILQGDSFWTVRDNRRNNNNNVLRLSDGPHGVRQQDSDRDFLTSRPATCFPTACCLANSWDTHLVYTIGTALQRECRAQNVHVLLGPGLNMKRHPAGGRNFEYFSEDPVVSARLATAYVRGVQQTPTSPSTTTTPIAACIKHYAVNNQETHRLVVNAVVDPRTLHELYLRPFLSTLRESQPALVMAAYNKVNGLYCCAHTELIQHNIRNKITTAAAHETVLVSDWGAVHDRPACLKAGLDLEMPGNPVGNVHEDVLLEALLHNTTENGDTNSLHAALDATVDRLHRLMDTYIPPDDDDAATNNNNPDTIDPTAMFTTHHALAQQAARESCVLLRNDGHLLPLQAAAASRNNNNKKSIALIGCYRYQGMGSSKVHAVHVTALDEALREALRQTEADGPVVACCQGYDPDDPDGNSPINTALRNEALAAASNADITIVCIGLLENMEAEGMDRDVDVVLPDSHEQLLLALPSPHTTVAVLMQGGVVCSRSSTALDRPAAVLAMYLAGQAMGGAVVDVLMGRHSPCGKLTESWPVQASDLLAHAYFPGDRERVEYREGLLVGYRYLDTANVPVRFPFGFGLSYTTFVYQDVHVRVETDQERAKRVHVELTVQNVGPTYAGREIVQVYVSCVKQSAVFRPVHELRAFTKTRLLQPGESETLSMELTEAAFTYYDIGHGDFVVEPHIPYEIQVGASSRDIRGRTTISFTTGQTPTLLARETYPPTNNITKGVDAATFQRRFAGTYHSAAHPPSPDNQYHYNSMLKEVASNRWLGKALLYGVQRAAMQQVKPGPGAERERRMLDATIQSMPLRLLVLFSEGKFPFRALDVIIALLNYQLFAAMNHTMSLLASMWERSRRR